MTFKDYPKSATNAAKRALKHKEDNGSNCGTSVGWTRANQLAKRQALSMQTVKRTFSFLSRAKTYDQGRFFDEDGKEICGSIMYAAWGGDGMRRWCEKTINKTEEKTFNAMEKRIYNTEVRAETGEGCVGYGIVFNSRTHLWGNVYEEIAPNGAELSEDIIVTFNHDFNMVLGRAGAGTATFTEDEKGVQYEVPQMPNTTYANDLKENLKLGNVRGSSFMFEVIDETWMDLEDGNVLRRVNKYKVYEMGPVTMPAYESTDSSLRMAKRSFESYQQEQNANKQKLQEKQKETVDYRKKFATIRKDYFENIEV